MTDSQGRSAAEVAANEQGTYILIDATACLLLILASAYAGWQVGGWLLRELI